MPKRRGCAKRLHTKPLALVVTVALLTTLLTVITPTTASAAGTVLFQNSFANNTVNGTGTVTKPTPTSGTNVACLTASGNSATLPLVSCGGTGDPQGSGKLRLTNSTANQVGGVFGATSFPTSNGLDVTFNSYQWGGGSADGIAFVLAAVDPANSVAPTTIGPSGGSLGYSPAGSVSGLPNAYLGVGLDVFGNFSATGFQGSGCTNAPNITAQAAGSVVVRGPGNVRVGYCGLTTTYDGTLASKTILRAATRAASEVPVQVLINPTASPFTSETGVVAAAGTYKVVVKPVGQPTKTLSGSLPTVAAGLYPSTTWTTAAGIPKQLAFGFVGSTGSVTDSHEISDARVLTFNPVPQLAVATTSYNGATPAQGGPVNYVITPSVLAGSDEPSPISVTQTVPAGVLPVGAFGAGWVCAAPVGRTVTCTTTAASFMNGTTLPDVNVVAIVTTVGMTSATILNSSVSSVSSADANPATDSIMTVGTLPANPSSISVTPAIGPIAGSGVVTVGGSNITSATAIEIGTTAEQNAGTPVTLLKCQGAAAPGCFTVSGGTLVISSMPARAGSASTTVTVVTLGVAGAAGYVYADRPATPATPTAAAGITSATISWTAPAENGSPISGYVITPYLANVAQAPLSFDAATTTRTLTGLTAGGSYRFTVAAVNAYGTSTASPQSVAITPYTLPGAPTISAVAARDSAASVSWNAPGSNGGSAITGYLVTPYIGGAPQPTQTFGPTPTTQKVTGLTPGTAYTFRVAAQNLAGAGPQSAPSAAVTPNLAPTLTFAAPPAGEVGAAYSNQFTVNNGTTPFVWSVSVGALPAGLSLNASTGVLSGIPTVPGSFAFTVQVTDISSEVATRPVTLLIAAAPTVTFAPTAGEVSIAYSQQPVLSGGTTPIVWAISAGALPAGLAINPSTGLISGTPTVSGNFPVTITATDSLNQTASRTATLVIAALPTLTFPAPVDGQVGVAYSAALSVTGGTLPLTWSITAGSLPSGLTLDSGTGVLSGTPTTVGSSSFTVAVVDAFSMTTNRGVTIVIGAGPLVIVKSANIASAAPGGVVSYTITVSNSGSTAWTGASLSDPLTGVLDDAVYDANATATAGTLSYTAETLGWTGTVPASGSITITYSVTVHNPDTGNKVLTNTVTSSTLGTNCSTTSIDPRCTANVSVAGLNILKTADAASTTPGGTVRFSIVVTNAGQTPYTGATLTDSLAGVLDDAAYNSDAVATAGSVSYNNPALTWTGDLAVGASATITYSVTVANPDNGNRTLTGTVVSPSAGSVCPSGNAAASCSATVTILVPALVITTAAGGSTTTPGAVVPFTITLANTGQTAYSGISVTLALAASLDDAEYNNDAAASAGGIVYDVAAGELEWTGNLAVGAVVTITASVTVRNPDLGNKSVGVTARSSAVGSTCPAAGTTPACTATVQVRLPELSFTKAANVSSSTPGSVVQYTVRVTNTGQTDYQGATFADSLTDVLDDANFNNDATGTVGVVSFGSPNLTWTGDLPIGATATITYSVTVKNPDSGNRMLTGILTSTTPGNSCSTPGGAALCTSNIPVLIPVLSFSGSADASTTTPGSVVRYTVAVTNDGQTAYNGIAVAIDVFGVFDDATYNNDATTSTGSLVTSPDGTVAWVLSLATGETAFGSMSFTVLNPDTGNHSLDINVFSNAAGSACPTGSMNGACHTFVTVLEPGLMITKSADRTTVSPGGTVEYTISLVNNGQTNYPAASFTDSLAAVLDDAAYVGGATASTGSVTYSEPTISWTGQLAPGATANITYSVTVLDPSPGDKQLSNRVVSTSPGNNCAAGNADARCTTTVNVLVPGLTIAKTANKATTSPGATVSYTVTVTNSGVTAFTAARFTDSLAGVLDDATFNADASATSGTIGVTGSTASWTGDLAIGASAIITYSVTVNTVDAGDDLLTNTIASTTPGNNCTGGSTDIRCTVVVPVARLVLSTGFTETSTTPGSVVHLVTTYTNTGEVPYTGISVETNRADVLDDAIANGDQTTSSGSMTISASTITWTGSIPIGGVVTILRSLTVQNPNTGNKIITATMRSDASGNNCAVGTTDSQCTFSIAVLIPGLTISKTASTPATVPGGTVGYTITVLNSGGTAYTGATVTDPLTGVLDDATYNGDAAATQGIVVFSTPTLTWTGDLAAGQSAIITYSITANNPANGDKTMVNTVTSTEVGSTCPPASGNPACHRTVVVLTPALSIVKTADLINATLGSTITFSVTVTNSGQTSQPSAAFTDSLAAVLDDATYNAPATTATSGTISYTGGVLSWAGSLSPGGSATITYTVTVNTSATGDRSMTNTVVSANTGNNCPAGTTDTRCTAVVTVVNAFSLTITKTANVPSTVAGGTVSYTVTIINATDAVITDAGFADSLGGILDDATYNNDAAASDGTVVVTDQNLTWSGNLAAGQIVTVNYSVTVQNPVTTGDNILTGTVTSTSLPASNNCLPASPGPRCSNTVTVAGLVIQQAYEAASTTPGSVIRLNATFTNTGTMPYQGITISSPSADTVDDAIPVGDQTATSGTLVLSAAAITWTGNIPVGGVVTVTGTLTVQNPDPGNKIITGTLVSTALGNNCPAAGSDPRCTALITVLLPGLTVTKTASATSVVPGGTVIYTLVVNNTGQTPYAAATISDSLVGVLDDADYNGDGAASSGSLSFRSPVLTWTGSLAVAATVTISYTVTANSAGTGDKAMVNTVSSTDIGSTCLPASGSVACRSTVIVLTPGLTVTSSASAVTANPGDVVTFTIIATNSGETSYPEANVSAPLVGVLDDGAYNGDASASIATVSVSGGTLTWTGPLASGAAVTITYSATVDKPVALGADHRLDQAVTSTTQGSNCATGSADPRCATSVPIASLRIVNTSNVSKTQPAGVVRYTGTYTNTGQVPYFGITVIVDVLGAADDSTYNGDGTATAGSVNIVPGAPEVSWTGDLAVGATAVFTASVTVNNPDLGDKILTSRTSTVAPGSNCPAASTDPLCVNSVPVSIPELTIVMAASATTTSPGSAVDYTIVISNTGPTAYTAATVSDPLGSVLTDSTLSGVPTATGGALTNIGQVLIWTGDLAVGEAVTISYSVMVNNPDLGDKLMVNRVVSDEIGSTCPTGGQNPACVAVVAVLVPALDIAVTADATMTTPGASVGYTVTIHNTGQTVYSGASVIASLAGVLDDGGPPVGLATSAGSVDFLISTVTWSGTLAINGTAVVTYSITVANPYTGDGALTTSVSSAQPGSNCTPGTPCLNTVTVLIPALTVSTTSDVATATPGQQVVFTITLTNTGQTTYLGATVSTGLGEIMDDATFDGVVNATIGAATYTNPNVSWTGTLHVGDTATITYAVTIRNPDPGDKELTTIVVAPAAGSNCAAGNSHSACTATVTVLVPALAISQSTDVATVTPGGVVKYTVRISNTGETAYANAVVTNSFAGVVTDAVFNDDAVVVGGGNLTVVGVTGTWIGNLPVGAIVTITYSITVNDPDIGDKQLRSAVTSTESGSSCPPGNIVPSCSTLVQVLVPKLLVTKTASTTTVVAGSPVEYTITLTNSGDIAYAPATFTDSLVGVLDDATYITGSATATAGTLQYADNTLAWSGPLAVGASAIVTYITTTNFPATGNKSLANSVVSGSQGSTCKTGAEPGCGTAVAVLVPGLTISKTANTTSVVTGGTIGYTLTATNTGLSDYSDANLTDDLTALAGPGDLLGATATSGIVTIDARLLAWRGALPVGATVVVDYTVRARLTNPDATTLVNTVTSTSLGSNCYPGSVDPLCVRTTTIAAQSITLTGLTPDITLNGLPNNIVSQDGATIMTVTTNSAGGYLVSVKAAAEALTGSEGNSDTIPIGRLSVRESGTTLFGALTAIPQIVHQQSGPSAPEGDAISNDYRIDIPFVEADTYTTTLDYIVTTQ